MAQIGITRCRVHPQTGRVYIRFSDGEEREYPSLAAMQRDVRNELDIDTLKAVALAIIMRRQPELSNPAAVEGRSVIADLASNNWGTLG